MEPLLLVCDCPYSVEYVTHTRLLCGSNENEAIYQANLLNTGGKTAAELKALVQLWVDNAPTISVAGALQQVDSYCQVDVAEIGNTDECVALQPTTPEPVESTEQALVPSHLTAVIAGSVGGVVGTIFLMVAIVIVLCVCSRKSARATLKEKVIFSPL